MKTISHIKRAQSEISGNKSFAIETTFVLFFLAVEFGQSVRGLTFDSLFLALTLLMVIVLPYFLPSEEKPYFSYWLLGRSLITVFAISLGLMLKQSVGVVLPEAFRFLPMTLLIVTAMLSCYIQFYGFLKLRFTK